MSFPIPSAVCEVAVYFDNFRNVDLFHQGLYRIHCVLSQENRGTSNTGGKTVSCNGSNASTRASDTTSSTSTCLESRSGSKNGNGDIKPKRKGGIDTFGLNAKRRSYLYRDLNESMSTNFGVGVRQLISHNDNGSSGSDHWPAAEFRFDMHASGSYLSRVFPIRYCEEDVTLNEGCVFRIEIDSSMDDVGATSGANLDGGGEVPKSEETTETEAEAMKKGYSNFLDIADNDGYEGSSDLYLEIELLYGDLTPYGGIDNCSPELAEQVEFRSASRRKLVIRKNSSMNGNPSTIHEYIPLLFDEFHFSQLDMQIHTCVTDYRYRLRRLGEIKTNKTGIKTIMDAKGDKEKADMDDELKRTVLLVLPCYEDWDDQNLDKIVNSKDDANPSVTTEIMKDAPAAADEANKGISMSLLNRPTPGNTAAFFRPVEHLSSLLTEINAMSKNDALRKGLQKELFNAAKKVKSLGKEIGAKKPSKEQIANRNQLIERLEGLMTLRDLTATSMQISAQTSIQGKDSRSGSNSSSVVKNSNDNFSGISNAMVNDDDVDKLLIHTLQTVWNLFVDHLVVVGTEISGPLRRVYERNMRSLWGRLVFQEKVELQSNEELYMPLGDSVVHVFERAALELRDGIRREPHCHNLFRVTDASFDPLLSPLVFEQRYVKKSEEKVVKEKESPKKVKDEEKLPRFNSRVRSLLDISDPEVKLSGTHLVVLVHGLQGNPYDMRLIKNMILIELQNGSLGSVSSGGGGGVGDLDTIFLCSSCNEDKTEGDIWAMGERLAEEVEDFIDDSDRTVTKLSFVGHSMGGLIIRVAIPLLNQSLNGEDGYDDENRGYDDENRGYDDENRGNHASESEYGGLIRAKVIVDSDLNPDSDNPLNATQNSKNSKNTTGSSKNTKGTHCTSSRRRRRKVLNETRVEFWTFLTLSSMHLGCGFYENKILEAGVWFLQRWRKSKALEQLSCDDWNTGIEDSFIYQLSELGGMELFNHIILVSSWQDQYSPFDSARAEICVANLKKQLSDRKFEEQLPFLEKMAKNFLGKVEPERVQRWNVNFYIQENTLDTLIGRTAHIQLIENQTLIRILVACNKYLFE